MSREIIAVPSSHRRTACFPFLWERAVFACVYAQQYQKLKEGDMKNCMHEQYDMIPVIR